MILREERMDLFCVPDDYCLAHCISADFAMGAGIATVFRDKFAMQEKLQKAYPDYLAQWKRKGCDGDCLKEDRVFNLVTKSYYWEKPTIISLRIALMRMKQVCLELGVKKVAMPRIGCGLDRLQWDDVKFHLQDVFKDTELEILVCYR